MDLIIIWLFLILIWVAAQLSGATLIDFFVPNAALIRVNTVLVIDNHT